MITKIIQIVSEFLEKFINIYFPAYFSWLADKLSGLSSFFVLSCSIGAFLVLAIYISMRNRN
jgi:hypothetical protein